MSYVPWCMNGGGRPIGCCCSSICWVAGGGCGGGGYPPCVNLWFKFTRSPGPPAPVSGPMGLPLPKGIGPMWSEAGKPVGMGGMGCWGPGALDSVDDDGGRWFMSAEEEGTACICSGRGPWPWSAPPAIDGPPAPTPAAAAPATGAVFSHFLR